MIIMMFWSSFNTWKQYLRAACLRGWQWNCSFEWSCFLVSVYFQQCSPHEGQNGTTSSVIETGMTLFNTYRRLRALDNTLQVLHCWFIAD